MQNWCIFEQQNRRHDVLGEHLPPEVRLCVFYVITPCRGMSLDQTAHFPSSTVNFSIQSLKTSSYTPQSVSPLHHTVCKQHCVSCDSSSCSWRADNRPCGSLRNQLSPWDSRKCDRLTDSPLSLFSRGHIEDIPLISSIWFIIRLNVYREFLHKWACIPERQNRNSCLEDACLRSSFFHHSGRLKSVFKMEKLEVIHQVRSIWSIGQQTYKPNTSMCRL